MDIVNQVDAIREEYNKNIDKMAVEIHELEQVSYTLYIKMLIWLNLM